MNPGWRATRERGSAGLIALVAWFALHAGRRPARALLYPIVLYFYCTAPTARRASAKFLRRALGRGPLWRDSWRHFYYFAATALDRLFFFAGRGDEFLVAYEDVDNLAHAQRARGCLVLMSHLGSFDAMRATAQFGGVPLSIVMDRKHGRMITALIERLDPTIVGRVIDAAHPGPALALAVKRAIDAGALVGLMADRVAEGGRTVQCRVLDVAVALPAGAYLLAAALRVPLIVAFGIYEGGRRYRLHFHQIDDTDAPLERDERVAFLAQRYADYLTDFARRYPYNWFNFYDYFADAAAGD